MPMVAAMRSLVRWINSTLPLSLQFIALYGADFDHLSARIGAGRSSGSGYGTRDGTGMGAAHGAYENDTRNEMHVNEHTGGQGDGTFTDDALCAAIDRLKQ